MKIIYKLIRFSPCFAAVILMGCYASGHKFYDVYKWYPPTTDCRVVWTRSIDNAKFKLDNELPPVEFLGSSGFSTARTYNENTAREDCMLAGGDYIIVVEEGYVGSKQSQYTVNSMKTVIARDDTRYYGSSGKYYGRSKSTTTYQIPTSQTYNVTDDYYGFVYFVYRKIDLDAVSKSKRTKSNSKRKEPLYTEDYDEDL